MVCTATVGVAAGCCRQESSVGVGIVCWPGNRPLGRGRLGRGSSERCFTIRVMISLNSAEGDALFLTDDRALEHDHVAFSH